MVLANRTFRTLTSLSAMSSAQPLGSSKTEILKIVSTLSTGIHPPSDRPSFIFVRAEQGICDECATAMERWEAALADESLDGRAFVVSVGAPLPPRLPVGWVGVTVSDVLAFKVQTGIVGAPVGLIIGAAGEIRVAVNGVPSDEAIARAHQSLRSSVPPNTIFTARSGSFRRFGSRAITESVPR